MEELEIKKQPIKVYIRVNNKNNVVEVGSSIFVKDATNWIEIDSGYGDKFAHAQSQYFDKPILDKNGSFNYKYENGKVSDSYHE